MHALLSSNGNYELDQQIYSSARTSVFRGRRLSDGQLVVVKTSQREFPSARDLSRLRREYSLLRRLSSSGAVRAHALEPWGNRLAIIQEPLGQPLSELEPVGRLGVPAFYDLAIALTNAISALHAHVAHLDVAPANIFWDSERALVKLIDFSRAVPLGEQLAAACDEISEASLPYVAPEQCGNMNRRVDQRADLYSLGAIFYELLTGRRLFAAGTRDEWFYAHITEQPISPAAIAEEIPAAVDRVVMRLLEKEPAQRYQSTEPLLHDLHECRERCTGTGRVHSIALSRRSGDGLRSPCTLHGRQQEIDDLLSAYDVVRSGATRAVIINGPAGAGKSALVEHVRTQITRLNGYFVRGKADPFGSARPYAALAEAFGQLTSFLLSEPDEEIARWSAELNAALSPNAQLLLEIVPELERIIGPQTKPSPSNPVEEQNRFLATIIAFVQCFAEPLHPFVLFLDDLQWVDAATVNLVQRLLSSHDVSSFLFIGAQRGEGEFTIVENSLAKRSIHPPLRLSIQPLQLEAVQRLLIDMLDQSTDDMGDLAAALHGCARGNPLHLIELVQLLERQGELVFDARLGRWVWGLERVRSVAAPRELAEIILARFRSLQADTQRVLSVASCIGSRFQAGFLADVCQIPFEELAHRLFEATQQGFLIATRGERSDAALESPRDEVRFRHDGAQQVAHSELSEAARCEAHFRIGTLMARGASEAERAERSLEVVYHLNQAVALVSSEQDRFGLLQLNLTAAAKATFSAAHESAYGLLEFARGLLPPEPFDRHFALAFDVHHRLAAAAYLVHRFDVATRSCAEILRRARTPLERANIFAMQLAQLTFCGRMEEAIEAGLRALATLGIRLSARPSRLSLLKYFAIAWFRMARRSIADIEHQPVLSDERARLCLKVLIDFIPPSYLTGNDRLFAASVLEQVNLSLRFGNGPESASTYASFTVLLAGLGQLRRADEFGRLALRLLDRFQARDSRCRNYLLYALFAHSWTRPWSELRRWFENAVQAGLESGDHLFTAYGCGWVFLWDPNVGIETAYEESKRYVSIIEKTEYQNARDAALLAQQLWLNLLGRTNDLLSLSTSDFDEAQCERRMRDARYLSGLGIYALYKLELCVYYERWSEGFDIIERSADAIRALIGSPYMVEYCLYGFLVSSSVRDGARARKARRQARRLRSMMSRWAAYAPENFGLHALLIDAEWAALSGNVAEATRLYHAATAPNTRPQGARYEAIANERAALFFLEQRLPRLAAVYLSAARHHYRRWGAAAKVRFIEQRYASVLELSALELELAHTAGGAVDPSLQRGHDLDDETRAIEGACKALAADQPLEETLSNLLAVVIQTLGATRATLLLKDADSQRLLVYADVDSQAAPRAADPRYLEQADLPTRLVRHVARGRVPVLLEDWERSRDFVADDYLKSARLQAVLAAPIIRRGRVLGVLYVENRGATRAFTRRHTALVQMLSHQAAAAVDSARLEEHLKQMSESFARVVPRQFLANLGRKNFTEIRRGESVQKEMTVLFSDMRGFTTIVESLGVSTSLDFLNEYLSRMEAPILENEGFVDSYAGDGILALFSGGPAQAVRAALSMLQALNELNGIRRSAGLESLRMGVGISTGPLTLGTIGGVERFKYGVVGDTVNLAARLEGLTKLYGVPLIVSGETRLRLDPETRDSTRFLGRVRVAGRQEPVDLFEVFAGAPMGERQRKQNLAADWHHAMNLYAERRFAEAAALFRELHAQLNPDPPSALFEHRALEMLANPPGPHWTPIDVLSQK